MYRYLRPIYLQRREGGWEVRGRRGGGGGSGVGEGEGRGPR